jgi:ssRNA-specific RNase YbeY (16S rRNA maturation enzyme)
LAKSFVNYKPLIVKIMQKYGIISDAKNTTNSELINVYTNALAQNQEFREEISKLIAQKQKITALNSSYRTIEPVTMAIIGGITSLFSLGSSLAGASAAKTEAEAAIQAEIIRLEAEKKKQKQQQYLIAGGIAVAFLAVAGLFLYNKTKK